MMAIDLFPAGVLQLADSLANGYWHARRLTFLMTGPVSPAGMAAHRRGP